MKKKDKFNKDKTGGLTRREYLKTSVMGAAGLFMAPTIVPSTVFGQTAPSNRINIGQIGAGRIARGMDIPGVIGRANDANLEAQIIAVSDVDSRRMAAGKEFIEQTYVAQGRSGAPTVRMYGSYKELIEQSDIDAVVISTPDHQHVMPAVSAAVAGKDVYVQKPFSLTIEEGRLMSNIMHKMGTVFLIGSQQRSEWGGNFRRACELVRNGRIGNLHTVEVGLPGDPPGGDPTPMPVPEWLDYDAWLGSTPYVPYTVDRVHAESNIDSPRWPDQLIGSRGGWLRCEQFSPGMITGWGAHHLDTAHWGMNTEYTGPISVEAECTFPDDDPDYTGLWNVHGDFRSESTYANGVTMITSGSFPNGIRFIGDEGWVFVTRGGGAVTASDPSGPTPGGGPLQASSMSILESEIGPNETHLYRVPDDVHHRHWIRAIKTREETVTPVEVAHRSTSACLVNHIAMTLRRPLEWDPINERFRNDDEANSMLSRPQRYPYTISEIPGLAIG